MPILETPHLNHRGILIHAQVNDANGGMIPQVTATNDGHHIGQPFYWMFNIDGRVFRGPLYSELSSVSEIVDRLIATVDEMGGHSLPLEGVRPGTYYEAEYVRHSPTADQPDRLFHNWTSIGEAKARCEREAGILAWEEIDGGLQASDRHGVYRIQERKLPG